ADVSGFIGGLSVGALIWIIVAFVVVVAAIVIIIIVVAVIYKKNQQEVEQSIHRIMDSD
ncbi:MAG: hypothetical protein EZS28_040435, partial [Streblomastix strix]